MAIVASSRNTFPLSDLLNYFGIARSTYYYRSKKIGYDPYSNVRPIIHSIYNKSGKNYGYRRIALVLKAKHEIYLDRKTVAKIMKQEGLKAKGKRKSRYSSYRGSVGRIAPDHIKRNFNSCRPFEKLVSDITEFCVGEKRIYLSPLIDLYNKEVVSWKIGLSPNMKMALGMLTDVVDDLKKNKPIIHTDQGVQYQNPQWQILLQRCGCTQSMSRKGNCRDNAVAESFFSRLKKEFSDGSNYKDPLYFMKKLDAWIHWYNEERIKESLSGMSPVEYRKTKNPPALDFVQL